MLGKESPRYSEEPVVEFAPDYKGKEVGNHIEVHAKSFVLYEAKEQPKEEILKTVGVFGLDIGAGHLSQAHTISKELAELDANCICGDILEILEEYAKSDKDMQALYRLDEINRASLVEGLYRMSHEEGLDLITRLSGNEVVMRLIPQADYGRALKNERMLLDTFAHFINANKFTSLVSTHPMVARMAELAKQQGLLTNESLAVLNFMPDPLPEKDMISGRIYDLGKYSRNDKNCVHYVRDDATANLMITKRYSVDNVKVLHSHYEYSAHEHEVIKRKKASFHSLAEFGPTVENPLIACVVQDNFETKDDLQAATDTLDALSTELIKGVAKLSFLMTDSEIVQLRENALGNGLAESQIYDARAVAQERGVDVEVVLAELYARDPKDIPAVVFVSKTATTSRNQHEYFRSVQRELILQGHLSISRPSEVPRVASLMETTAYLTSAYGSVEGHMEKVYKKAGIAADFTYDARSDLMMPHADSRPVLMQPKYWRSPPINNTPITDFHLSGDGDGAGEQIKSTLVALGRGSAREFSDWEQAMVDKGFVAKQ